MDPKHLQTRSATFDQIRDLSRLLQHFQEQAVSGTGLSFSQFTILDFAWQFDPLPQQELQRFLKIEKSTASRRIKPLVSRGLLKKKADPADRRKSDLHLTETGELLYNRVWGRFSEEIQRLFSSVPPQEQLRIAGSMQVISKALNNCLTPPNRLRREG